MKTWFSKRGYTDKIIENEMKKANFGESRIKTKSAAGVPFVVTYHPRLKALGKIIHENLNLLYMNDEVKDLWSLLELSENAVVTWLEPNYTHQKEFQVLGHVVKNDARFQDSDTFRSSVTFETFKINHRLTCDVKCLVYLFTCKTCSKQYTGETTDQFGLK